MTSVLLPDIPRILTALAEWGACLTYALLVGCGARWRRLVVVMAVGLAALIGVQFVAGSLPTSLWTAGMLMAVATMFALLAVATGAGARVGGYLVARAFVLAELVASLHWQLHSYFVEPDADRGLGVRAVFAVVAYAVAFAVAFVLERRHFPRGRAPWVDARSLASAMAIAAVTFLMSNLSFVTANTPFSGRSGTEVFYIRTLVDLAGYVALYAQQGQRLEQQRTRDVDAMGRLLATQHEQYLRSKRSMDAVNRTYHDLKHYIAVLRAETDPELKASHLDRLEEEIHGYGAQVVTGHGVLDVVLTAKAAECSERGIAFTAVVDGTCVAFVDAMDLSALFGNALDNAIEAAARVPDPDRRLVRVSVRRQDDLVLVGFENYFEGPLDFDDGLPRTTKSDGRHHGYGLRNMRQIAERYGGVLTVRAERRWFVVTVLLPVPERTAGTFHP